MTAWTMWWQSSRRWAWQDSLKAPAARLLLTLTVKQS